MALPGRYYVLECRSPDMMLLYSPEDPSFDDGWLNGQRFTEQPTVPVVVRIVPTNEAGELLPIFTTATLMRDDFYQAVLAAGVDNLEVYDAVIQSEDGSVVHAGYKAFNIVGVVAAADMAKTVFDADGPRLIDASIESLAIDADRAGGFLCFRLAEYVGAIIVHETVKKALEDTAFPHVAFRLPEEFLS